MNKILWIVGGLIVVIVIVIVVVSKNAPSAAGTPTPSVSATVSAAPTPSASTTPTASPSAIKTINISGKPFSYDITEIKVKKGDTVKIVFTNTEGTHDWVVDEFNTRTKVIQAGKTDEVTFIADKTGTFEYYCSVGQHRQMGMKGNLIVE